MLSEEEEEEEKEGSGERGRFGGKGSRRRGALARTYRALYSTEVGAVSLSNYSTPPSVQLYKVQLMVTIRDSQTFSNNSCPFAVHTHSHHPPGNMTDANYNKRLVQ